MCKRISKWLPFGRGLRNDGFMDESGWARTFVIALSTISV
jgi:hypothetical protein